MKYVPAAWFLTLQAKGQWSEMKNSFLSLLVPAGALVSSPGSSIAKFVMRSTPFGVFLYKCRQLRGNILSLAPDPSQSIEFVSVESPAGWKIAELNIVGHLPEGADPSSATLCLKHKGKAFSLLRYACRRGFRGMTCDHLRRLHDFLGVPVEAGCRPTSESALLLALAKFVLMNEATDEIIQNMVSARHPVADACDDLLEATKLFDQGFEGEFDFEQAEDPDIEKQLQQLREKKERLVAKRAEALKAAAGLRLPQPQPEAPAQRCERKFVPAPAGGLSQIEAQLLLPEGFRLSKDDRRENRWRLRGPGITETSRSWGRRSHFDDYGAMSFLVQLAWRAHSRRTGEECPWEFQARPEDGAAAP